MLKMILLKKLHLNCWKMILISFLKRVLKEENHSTGGKPGKLNRRIPPQHSVFVFGVDKVIEPDSKCFVKAKDKQKILDSIERFSHTTETIIFPDFDGFIRQRTQERPYIPEGYESIRAAGYRAYRWEEYEKAISYFDKVIELKPEENDVYYMRGQSKQSLKRNAEAIDDYNKAIELKDNDMNYYQSRGMAVGKT